jgi:hypothetical protein
VTEDKSESGAEQGLGDLEPFAIVKLGDAFAVASRAEGNLISVAPLRAIPDPPHRTLLQCPCRDCRRWFVMSQWPSGVMTLKPLSDDPEGV